MKELPDPWPNWLGRAGADAATLAVIGKDSAGNPRHAVTGPTMEAVVEESIETTAKAFVAKIKDPEESANVSLKEVLKPIFCETGVTILGPTQENPFDFRHLIYLPPAPIRDLAGDFLKPGQLNKMAKLPSGEDYAAQHNLEIPSAFGPILSESKAKDVFIRNLQIQDVIDESLVVAASMVDFPNALYSKRRCGLLNRIPDISMNNLGSSKAVSDHLLDKMQDNDSVDVQEFVVNLKAAKANLPEVKEKFTKKLGIFLDKCRKEDSAVRQIDKLYALYRAKLIPYLQKAKPLKHFVKLPIIEHFPGKPNSPSAMFSEAQKIVDGVYAEQEGLGLTEECQLNLNI
jgi:hypothetical protein